MKRFIIAAAFALVAGAAHAEVVDSATNGFTSRHVVTVALTPQAAYDRFVNIGTWWDGAHTYSGDARKLTLIPRPGGAWTEALGGGDFVEHARVIFAQRGKTLRFSGCLGPLQQMGVSCVMTATFAAEGAGTKVTFTTTAGGYFPGGAAQIAAPVDGVLGQAMARYANTSPPK